MADLQAAPTPAREPLARSQAFREASLRSETRRAYAVIGVIGLVALLVFNGGASRDLDPRLQIAGVTGIAALLVLQISVLVVASWSRRKGRDIPLWFITATVLLESLIPTAMMFAHIATGTLRPYAVLSSPPILAYGIMITLTTLRLRASALGYAGLLA
jgi:hypothetical protein